MSLVAYFGPLGYLWLAMLCLAWAYCLWHVIVPNDYQAKRIYATARRAKQSTHRAKHAWR